MAIALTTPITVAQTVASVQITGFSIDYENLSMTSSYMTLLEDNTPYQRGNVVVEGYESVKAMYAELDAKIAEGKTFEEASTELLYAKVLSELA